MKKYWFVHLALLPLLVIITNCQKKKESSSANREIILTMMSPETGDEAKPLVEIIAAYKRQNPNVTIKRIAVKAEDLATTLPLQFSVEKTPADIIGTTFTWFIQEQGEKGHLLDVASLFTQDDFIDGAFSTVSNGNKVYAGPFSGGVTSLEYRKSFFSKHSLADPKSIQDWPSFISLIDAINKIDGIEGAIGTGGGVGWPMTSIIEAFILNFGGLEMHQQLTQGEISWEDPRIKNIFLEYLLPLIQNGSFASPDEFSAVLQAMWRGKHAFFWGDSTDSANVSPAADRGVALLPGQNSVVFWKSYFFIPIYSQHRDQARDFLQFFLTEGQSIAIKEGGRIASYKNIDPSQYPPAKREVVELIAGTSVIDDLDDTVGGRFQTTMWEQWFLLWANPTEQVLDQVLTKLAEAMQATS